MDFFHAEEAIKEIHMNVLEAKSSNINRFISGSQSLTKEITHKTIKILDPHMKETLLNCLSEKNLPRRVSGEEDVSEYWYTKYLGSLFSKPRASWRYLSRELLESNADASAPAPAPVDGMPISSPTPSPAPEPSSSGVPFSPGPVSPVLPFFPSDRSGASSPPFASDTSGSNVSSHKPSSNKKSVVIAVVVTASVTLFVAGLLFCCYRRAHRTGSQLRRNDERPLLTLSISDYTIGML